MTSTLVYVFSVFLLPPGVLIIGLLLGILLFLRHKVIGGLLFLFTCIAMYLISTPFVANELMSSLETYKPVDISSLNTTDFANAGAIVVLSGGRGNDNVEQYGDTVNDSSLVRLRYAAKLARKFQLPVLLSGGKVSPWFDKADAYLMQDVMINDFGVQTEYLIDDNSKNTKDNAKFTADILNKIDVKKIFLVTQAWHMQRAVLSFEHAGFSVIPVPTDFYILAPSPIWMHWLPKLNAFVNSSLAVREYLGILWYKISFLM